MALTAKFLLESSPESPSLEVTPKWGGWVKSGNGIQRYHLLVLKSVGHGDAKYNTENIVRILW